MLEGTELILNDWKALMPELVDSKKLDSASAKLINFILYLIISFGIFGTILMMVRERMYEFGVLVAIGMKRYRLFTVVWLEILSIAIIGALAGFLICFPMAIYFNINPIRLTGNMAEAYEAFGVDAFIKASVEPRIFFQHAVFVFVISLILGMYPLNVIAKFKPVKAMRD